MGQDALDQGAAVFGELDELKALDCERLLRETFVARVEVHAELGSTNDHAKQRAQHPACATPLLVVAERQTAGRGRGTHRWWSGSGALTFSMLIGAQQLPPRRSPLLSLGTAVAVAQTVAPLAAPHAVGLHWPNDVMAAGRKVAGILIEILGNGQGVIGIGVNTNNQLAAGAPDEVRAKAVTLLDLAGQRTDPTEVLLGIVQRVEQVLKDLHAGPERVAAAADELCQQRGQTLRMLCGTQHIEGRCAGIGPDGALLLDTAEGRREVHSGVGI